MKKFYIYLDDLHTKYWVKEAEHAMAGVYSLKTRVLYVTTGVLRNVCFKLYRSTYNA